jgi:hypothetical protein
MKCFRILLLCGVIAAAATSARGQQPLQFGLRAGVPLNAFFESDSIYKTALRPYTFGPQIELNLPAGFGIEFDALYKRTGVDGPFSSATANSWEFPLLVKYKFPGKIVRPYVDGGFVFRHLSDLSLVARPQELVESTSGSTGIAFGAGLRINLGLIRLWPELRYTRWNNDGFTISGGAATLYTYFRNQTEVLVGLTF